MEPLVLATDSGLYCPRGDFYIDPWRPVRAAFITHAHSDHARWGMRTYITARPGVGVLRARLGESASIHGVEYGETLECHGVRVSLHPAGHTLGSAQVRIETQGYVTVVSGDYKTEPDGVCAPFQPLRCHAFITESTFGLPIYRWRPQAEVFAEINAWWRENQLRRRTSLLYGYALGKAQRLLSGLDPAIGPILLHGAVQTFLPAYAAAGVTLPDSRHANPESIGAARGRAIVIAPPSAAGSGWVRRFRDVSTAFASGWMAVRGTRRRRSVDRGFALSDHADWDGLLAAIRATGAETIGVTHGYTGPLVRWLRENGWDAFALQTRYEGEREDPGDLEPESGAPIGDAPPAAPAPAPPAGRIE